MRVAEHCRYPNSTGRTSTSDAETPILGFHGSHWVRKLHRPRAPKNAGKRPDCTTTGVLGMARILLTAEAAAEQLSLSRTTVYALIGTGELRSVKIGRGRRVPTDALTEYANSLAEATATHQFVGA